MFRRPPRRLQTQGNAPAWQLGSTRPRVRLRRSSQPFRSFPPLVGLRKQPKEPPSDPIVYFSPGLHNSPFGTGFSWPGCNFCHLALCRALEVSTWECPWQNRDLRASHCFLECFLQVLSSFQKDYSCVPALAASEARCGYSGSG